MAKQNRAEDHSIFQISSRIKAYGDDLSVFDIDTGETTYTTSNRGVFSLVFELKACWYTKDHMRAPKVNMSQLLALFYNVQPTFLCFYSEDYSYRVVPANYAAVVWSGTRQTRILTEEEFQVLFTSVSPCQPTEELNKVKYTPTSFCFFDEHKKEYGWNLYDGFAGIAKQISWYLGQNNNIKEAWQDLSNKLPEPLYQAHKGLWQLYKEQAQHIV